MNEAALARLGQWVPGLFPRARYQPGTGGYRVSSRDLGRRLQEDLSLSPEGIVDFGVHDMGDARQGKRTPIDMVMEYGGASDAVSAARWLCDRLGMDANAEWDASRPAAPDIDIRLGQPAHDPETGEVMEDGTSVLGVFSAAEFAGQPVPERLWHVPGLVPHGTVTILSGDGGTGKSLLAMQLAAATVLGEAWIGLQVEPGPALFLSAEDDVPELHRRLAGIADHHGRDLSEFAGLSIAPMAGRDAVLGALEGRSGLIRKTPVFAALEMAIVARRPRLVVLDTLADLFGGNEIDRAQARQFIAALRGLAIDHDLALVLLAHPSMSGLNSGSGSSGSTAWSNSVRSRLYFRRILSEDGRHEPDPDARVLEVKKTNYARTGAAVALSWQDGVFCPVEMPAGGLGAMAAEATAERVFMDCLEAFTSEGRQVSATRGHGYAPAIFAVDPRSGSVGKRDLEAAMGRLFRDGKIRQDEFGPPSRRVRRIVVAPATAGGAAGGEVEE